LFSHTQDSLLFALVAAPAEQLALSSIGGVEVEFPASITPEFVVCPAIAYKHVHLQVTGGGALAALAAK
jgi:hypothetical protein